MFSETVDTRTRTNSKPEDLVGPTLDEVIKMDRERNKANQKAKHEARKAADNNSATGNARRPEILLGEIVWKDLLQGEDELEGIDYMD